MRVNYTMVIFLAWISTMLLFTEYHKANFTLVEQAYAEQTLDSENVDASLKVSILDQVLDWIWSKHHQFQHSLTYELQKLRGRDSVGWSLVLISFLYGVLHAAGPGHGKVVLTTYLLTHRNQLRRGVAMGISAALLQGVTALLLVYGLVGLAGWLPKETESASMWATRLSFTLVAIVGLYLLLRASNVLFRTVHQMQYQSDPIHHDHTNHDNKEGCGCRHQPSVAEINSSSSKHAFAGVVLSIGLRPCSGAVLVLILATTMDLIWHGALAAMAMSIGTATTIVILAFLATMAREWTSSLVAYQSPFWSLAASGVGVLGGSLLLLFGLWLLITSFAL